MRPTGRLGVLGDIAIVYVRELDWVRLNKKSSEDLNRQASRLTFWGQSLVSRGASDVGSPRCLNRLAASKRLSL